VIQVAIREYIVNGGIGWVIALIVLVLVVVALFGAIAPTTGFVLLLIAGCALSRML
jgi:hypothetical protein